MLARLSIRDVVLIDQLDLEFSSGLTILTGETGAGKSILLDALSLALGARGDGGLVRHDQAVSVQALRALASSLVEIHGQHDERALTDQATHRALIDSYGGLEAEAR